MAPPTFPSGARVELIWHRGLPNEWLAGTMLKGGRSEIDNPGLFVDKGPFILLAEEIAAVRLVQP